MNRNSFYVCLLVMLFVSPLAANDIYVSPNGQDTNLGTLESPFRSINRAKLEVREMIAQGLSEDVNVLIRGGVYQLNETEVFGLEDSPYPYFVNYQAYKEEVPVISAGLPIQDWRRLDKEVDGLPAVAKGKVWVADVPKDLRKFKVLFDGDSRLVRAKSDTFKMPVNKKIKRADSQNTYFNKDRIHLRMVPYPNDEIKDWDNLSDVEVFFNPIPWSLNFIQLESVDTVNKIGYLAFEANAMPFTNEKFSLAWVENVIDYLDEPGEWCVNTKAGKIYYWPEAGKPSDKIVAPQLMELFKVEGNIQYDLPNDVPVKNINFKGLTFTHGDRSVWYKNRKGWGIQHDWDTFDYGNAMLRFRGAENCSVDACRFTNSGGSGVRLDLHAQDIKIQNNFIDYVGHMGILLCGYGPGTKDVNKNNTITNNLIHHTGEIIWHGHAIFSWQSGSNLFANNYIHDVPRKAIGLCGVRCQILMKPEVNFDEASRTIRWSEIENTIDSALLPQKRYAPYLHARNNVIEHNRAERTLLKLNDGSSINVSGAGTGNIVRHNYLYDIPHVGFRTDDWQDGTTFTNNIVHKAGIGIIHKGVNDIENNIFIDCKMGIKFRAYPQQYFEPKSSIQRNILYSASQNFKPNSEFKWDGRMFVHRSGTKPIPYEFQMDYNLYWSPNISKSFSKNQKEGIETHGQMVDPEFRNLNKQDYKMGNKKLLKSIGFKSFDTSLDAYGITPEFPKQYLQMDDVARGAESL